MNFANKSSAGGGAGSAVVADLFLNLAKISSTGGASASDEGLEADSVLAFSFSASFTFAVSPFPKEKPENGVFSVSPPFRPLLAPPNTNPFPEDS